MDEQQIEALLERGTKKGAIGTIGLVAAALLLASAAHAAVVAVAQQGQHRLELHDQAGHCLGEARLAVYADDKQRIPGCWLVRAEGVSIAFLDGDHIVVPAAAFRKPSQL